MATTRTTDQGATLAPSCISEYTGTPFDDQNQSLPNDNEASLPIPRSGRKRRHNPANDDVLGPIQKKLKRISQSSELLLLRQYELQHAEQTLATCELFVSQSAEKLIETSARMISGVDIDSCRSQLEETCAQLKSDSSAFREKLSDVQRSRYLLTQDQARLKARFDKLCKLLKDTPLELHLHTNEELEEIDFESNTSSAHSSTRSSTPTLLAKFYDKKGDVGVFRERLGELDYNYQEGLAERELIQDRGDAVDLSDEQYQEKYFRERGIILNDLEKAEQEVVKLAQTCKELGLETTVHARNSSSEAVSSNIQADLAQMAPGLAASDPVFRRRGLGDVLPRSADRDEVRVQRWIDTLPQEGPSPTSLGANELNLEHPRLPIRRHRSEPSGLSRFMNDEQRSAANQTKMPMRSSLESPQDTRLPVQEAIVKDGEPDLEAHEPSADILTQQNRSGPSWLKGIWPWSWK